MLTLTSKDNPHIKRLVALQSSKKERDAAGLFVCEGVRLCLDLFQSGCIPEELYITRAVLERYPAFEEFAGLCGESAVLADHLSDRLSDTKTPQGVFAVCKKLDNTQSAVTIKKGGRYLLLSTIQDPGNLGSMIRSCEAFGLDGLFLSADSADLYSPRVIRASMGGIFRLPVVIANDVAGEVGRLEQSGIPVYAATAAAGAKPVRDCDFSGGAAVLIGNEGNGLPPELIEACSEKVMIPMAGGAESLNAGVAAGILLWEMTGDRELKKT